MVDSTRPLAPTKGPLCTAGHRRVLLASAQAPLRRILAAHLVGMGLVVVQAATSEKALAAAADRPDFVLCDGSLPDLPLQQLCAQCRSLWGEDAYSYILAILDADVADAAKVLAAGADDFVVAPVVPMQLTARLVAGQRFLQMAERLHESRRAMADTLARLQEVQAATEADLTEARRLQEGLLGARNARFGPIETSLLLRPAGHVGGDLVGFFPINARRAAFYAIDVSGNGVAAALLTARLHAHLSVIGGENIALRLDEHDLYDARGPAEVVQRFNHLMLEEVATETYFTMIYVDLDVATGRGRLVQAGHPHPLLQQADGSVEVLGTGGLPIGLIRDGTWDEVEFELAPGARLFISSDGITEAENPVGGMLCEEGLVAILRTNAFLRGPPLLESLCWSVAQFTQGKRTDDISAILIERDAE